MDRIVGWDCELYCTNDMRDHLETLCRRELDRLWNISEFDRTEAQMKELMLTVLCLTELQQASK